MCAERVIRVMILLDYYLPGEKSGGPTRSIANLVDELGDEFAFSVITRNHDLGCSTPYSTVKSATWQRVGKAQVMYLHNGCLNATALATVLRHTSYDVLYINSPFSFRFGITPLLLRKVGLIGAEPVIIASRGQLSMGALQLKGLKKRIFLKVAGWCGLYRQGRVTWQASSVLEEHDVQRILQSLMPGRSTTTRIAENLGSGRVEVEEGTHGDVIGRPVGSKRMGELSAAFLSRISPMKNLLGAIEALQYVKGAVTLVIHGPIEDEAYWARCVAAMAKLPPRVTVRYDGPVAHEAVSATLARYDLLLLPSFGENFGHVIAEALVAGCPVLTTHATPWAEIETAGAGSVIHGTDPASIAVALQRHVDQSDSEWEQMSLAAKKLGSRRNRSPEVIARNRALFREAAQNAIPRCCTESGILGEGGC